MSGIKRYLSDNAYKAAEHSESPGESNPFVTLHKAITMRSDWNENDTTQYNYILNRTHYVDYIPTDYEAEEATFVNAGGYARGSIYGYASGHSLYPEGFTEALAEGMPFKFVIGDTTYEGIAHRSGSLFYAGNRHIADNVFPDTGESWCVSSGMFGMAKLDFYIDSSYIGTTQSIVPTTYSEVVHQLPTKFISSDLATKENVANKKTSLDENSDTYYPTQKAVKTALDAKADDIKVTAIQGLIPTQASPTNQLADRDFVNSSIATSTAIFRGTFNSVDDLPTSGVDNNDYAFVKIFDSIQTDEVLRYDRYKWSNEWSFEYSLNNSSFTAAQWNAINSNATAAIISDLLSHASNVSNPHAVTKSQVGLGNVDNTSDLDKPLSTAAIAGLTAKQNALGFTPENVANKKTTLADNSDTYYPTQKAVKTAVDAKATGAASSVANEVAVYDGVTGKVLKSGSGVSAVGGNLTATNDMASTTKTIANKVRMEYDPATDTLEFNFL